MATQFGSRLSLIAFATASLRGLLHGADFSGTLQTALVAGAAFWVLGVVVGELARRLIEEHAEAELVRIRANSEPTDRQDRQR